MNTQEYGRRPYGVGFLVIGVDGGTGPHLYDFSQSGTSFEYFAVSIGAPIQGAKMYLEKHFESFADCTIPYPLSFAFHRLANLYALTERHDLIPPTSGSDRREVPGIEATGHFSDT